MAPYLNDITLISVGVATVAFILAIVALVELRNSRKSITSNEFLDASALVQEFRSRYQALEETLVDLRVRVEILDLRVARFGGKEVAKAGSLGVSGSLGTSDIRERPSLTTVPPVVVNSNVGDDPIHREILSAVKNANGQATSREIQVRVGRSREHVARTMNTLRKQGLLHRNQETRPFTYSITVEGENELERFAQRGM